MHFLILLVLLLCCPDSWPNAQESVPANDDRIRQQSSPLADLTTQQLVNNWLIRDCGVGAEVLRLHLQQQSDARAEALFWDAFRSGMPDGETDKLRAILKERYRVRHTWLNDHGHDVLGESRYRIAADVSEATYVEQQLQLMERSFLDRALAGLGVVGTWASVERLRTIADNATDPGRDAAREALVNVQRRLSPEP